MLLVRISIYLKSILRYKLLILNIYYLDSRSQRPRGLRRGSAAARLLGCGFESRRGNERVSCECCVLSGRGHCVRLITHPEMSYRVWCVWAWSWSPDTEEALAPLGAVAQRKKKIIRKRYIFMWARTWGSVVIFRSQNGPNYFFNGKGLQPSLWSGSQVGK